MPINIANVELSYSFDEWRVTTNQVIQALKNEVETREGYEGQPLSPYDLDSIIAAVTPLNGEMEANDTVSLTDVTKINNFKAGQKIKIFGAHPNIGVTYAQMLKPSAPSTTKNGLTGSANPSTFSYKIITFDLTTGKYSPASSVREVANVNTAGFNAQNNIALNISRTDLNYGVLVYRKISGGGINTATFNLIAVLGPKELPSPTSIWIDYYTFDYNPGSGKNARNEFDICSELIHFPLTLPENPATETTACKGWVNAEIDFVNTSNKTIRFTETFDFECDILIVQDDTVEINDAIQTRFNSGYKSLAIREKTYYVSKLEIPLGFSLYGRGDKSVIKKLPWSSDIGNKILKTPNEVRTSNFSISGLTIDGNMVNQYLVSENADEYANYAIQLQGTNIQFNDFKLTKVIGGGIYSASSNNVTMNSSEISNGGTTDRYSYSPLIVNNNKEIIVSGSLFKNFSSALDASSVIVGNIIGNIIQNCGSGLLTYASSFLNSSTNIILGNSGEYIPNPDGYDSTYDSVNIVLEPNMPFLSDFYVYQENGEPYDLATYARPGDITYRVDKLRKVNGVEELYGEITIGGVSPLVNVPGTDLANGQFRFSITESNVNALKTTYSYSTLKGQDANHIGLSYRALFENWVPSSNLVITAGSIVNTSQYIVEYVDNISDISVGTRVRLANHSGNLTNGTNLNDAIGTVIDINNVTKRCTIQYSSAIQNAGNSGQITAQNKFVLAKGLIQ